MGKVKWGNCNQRWPGLSMMKEKGCRVCGVSLPVETEEPKKRRALDINLLQLSGVDMVSVWLQLMT